MTVAEYLKQRLEELGLDRLFGVAGNYAAAFLDTILADPHSPIAITGISNELCAGYAADAYARLKGIGAVTVTYGVGSFSLLNAVAGASVELVPLVIINGAPTNKEFQNQQSIGLLYSHMLADPNANLDVFRRVTLSAQRIVNASEAPFQIDAALAACVTHRQPVYLEVLEDVWRGECRPPDGALPREQVSVTVSMAQQAAAATLKLVQTYGKPMFWAGVEIQRFGLQPQLLDLLQRTGIRFITSVLGKSVLSEDHPLFDGVKSPAAVLAKVALARGAAPRHGPANALSAAAAGDAGCVIGLGAWTTGKNVSNQDVRAPNLVLAAHGGVSVGQRFFASVTLRDYIEALTAALTAPESGTWRTAATYAVLTAKAPVELTYDRFFDALSGWMKGNGNLALVADAGFPLIGAQDVHLSAQSGFVAQASWLAIGYSTAASIGVKCARPDKRVVVTVGDGAFQETCQAVSSHAQLKHNTVVFVIANGIYGIEQKIVNPNPFRAQPVHYRDELLNTVFAYNTLHPWAYERLTDVVGGIGRRVATDAELSAVLAEIDAHPNENFIVRVVVPELDTPRGMKKGLAETGDDETESEEWPPALFF